MKTLFSSFPLACAAAAKRHKMSDDAFFVYYNRCTHFFVVTTLDPSNYAIASCPDVYEFRRVYRRDVH